MLLDHPDGVVPVPHGLHGARLTSGGSQNVEFAFVEGPNFEGPNGNGGTYEQGILVVRSTVGGIPVGGVRVQVNTVEYCYDRANAWAEPVPYTEVLTGPDGSASISVPPGSYSFRVLDHPQPLEPRPYDFVCLDLAANDTEGVEFVFTSGPYFN